MRLERFSCAQMGEGKYPWSVVPVFGSGGFWRSQSRDFRFGAPKRKCRGAFEMRIPTPYLLFLGDATYAKTAQGVRDWRPESCLAQFRFPGSPLDLGLPDMGFDEAVLAGARTLLIGVAPAGGQLPEAWIEPLEQALAAGLDIASGLHTRLNDDARLKARAEAHGRTLHDVRRPTIEFDIGDFAFRPGRRVLTVGTDCAVGKKYTALAIEREMRQRGIPADFRATGQTGLLISGQGVVIDSVIADFISAAAAMLSPANAPDHWDVIEGQGSLFHPAYAGVTLGLVHGSQPDAMILCGDPARDTIGGFPLYARPPLQACIEAYTGLARLTNPDARVAGISLNTSSMSAAEAERALREAEDATGLPAVDSVRTGVARLVNALVSGD